MASDDTCDCGCGNRARPGLRPRFVDGFCRDRWIKALSLHGQPAPDVVHEAVALDAGPQGPPPAAAPVPAEEIAEVQTEFAQRVTAAPAVEVVLESAPSGMWVQPRRGSLWKLLTSAMRKVR